MPNYMMVRQLHSRERPGEKAIYLLLDLYGVCVVVEQRLISCRGPRIGIVPSRALRQEPLIDFEKNGWSTR